MEIYLPIAEQSMNVFVLLGLGGAAGLLAGMFGVGGGFLATPLLIFVGIPPTVAVASQANQVVANSISSLQVQWRRGNVDLRMGLVLLLGGMLGSSAGVWLFTYLKRIGQIDFVIAVIYVVLLSSIGLLMLIESLRTYVKRRRNPEAPRGKLHTHYLVHRLPWKMRFYKSKLYISAFLPIGLGFVIGILSAILGVGGGFVLVPAMIYLLGMPTTVVIGTSNFQILFVAANVTFLQAATNGTVDVVLALLLILGGVVGAPIGSRLAAKLPGVVLRGLMAVLILGVAAELLIELLRTPGFALLARRPRGAAVRRLLVALVAGLAWVASAARPGPARRAAACPACRGRRRRCPPSAPTPELIVDLSRARVSITSAFQGESLLLFGMFDPPGEWSWSWSAPRARDGDAQGALPGPVAQHRPPGLRRRAGLLLHRRQRAAAAPAGARRGRRDPVARGPYVEHPVGARAPTETRQVPRRAGRGEAPRGPLSGRLRPGHGAGRPAVPGRAALSVAPAGGDLRRQGLSPARGQDRRRGVAAPAGRQGRLQCPAGRLVEAGRHALRPWRHRHGAGRRLAGRRGHAAAVAERERP